MQLVKGVAFILVMSMLGILALAKVEYAVSLITGVAIAIVWSVVKAVKEERKATK